MAKKTVKSKKGAKGKKAVPPAVDAKVNSGKKGRE